MTAAVYFIWSMVQIIETTALFRSYTTVYMAFCYEPKCVDVDISWKILDVNYDCTSSKLPVPQFRVNKLLPSRLKERF